MDKCNHDCFNCIFADCIVEGITEEEKDFQGMLDDEATDMSIPFYEYQKRYNRTPKGRARIYRYNHSEKGKAARDKYEVKRKPEPKAREPKPKADRREYQHQYYLMRKEREKELKRAKRREYYHEYYLKKKERSVLSG